MSEQSPPHAHTLTIVLLCPDDVLRPYMSEEKRRQYQDFREIFAKSGFGGNPERMAFAFLGQHLGNVDYEGVSYNYP